MHIFWSVKFNEKSVILRIAVQRIIVQYLATVPSNLLTIKKVLVL